MGELRKGMKQRYRVCTQSPGFGDLSWHAQERERKKKRVKAKVPGNFWLRDMLEGFQLF